MVKCCFWREQRPLRYEWMHFDQVIRVIRTMTSQKRIESEQQVVISVVWKFFVYKRCPLIVLYIIYN